jgi:hypothetical protein
MIQSKEHHSFFPKLPSAPITHTVTQCHLDNCAVSSFGLFSIVQQIYKELDRPINLDSPLKPVRNQCRCNREFPKSFLLEICHISFSSALSKTLGILFSGATASESGREALLSPDSVCTAAQTPSLLPHRFCLIPTFSFHESYCSKA